MLDPELEFLCIFSNSTYAKFLQDYGQDIF